MTFIPYKNFFKKIDQETSDDLNRESDIPGNNQNVSPEFNSQMEKMKLELAEYMKQAQKWIDGNQMFLNTFAKDTSLSFKFGDAFYIDLKKGEINMATEWFFERGFTQEQILWANMHEIAHFRDLVKDPERLMENFNYIKKQAKKTGDIILTKWKSVLDMNDPKQKKYYENLSREINLGSKKNPFIANQVTAQMYKVHHSFYNCLDDIWVNNWVADNAPRFEKGESGGKEIERLYREKLFPGNDYSTYSRHRQFMYSLLRREMIPEDMVLSPDVEQALNKPIKVMGKLYTPAQIIEIFIKPKKGRNTLAGDRYEIIKITLEPIFEKLLQMDIDQWQPEYKNQEQQNQQNQENNQDQKQDNKQDKSQEKQSGNSDPFDNENEEQDNSEEGEGQEGEGQEGEGQEGEGQEGEGQEGEGSGKGKNSKENKKDDDSDNSKDNDESGNGKKQDEKNKSSSQGGQGDDFGNEWTPFDGEIDEYDTNNIDQIDNTDIENFIENQKDKQDEEQRKKEEQEKIDNMTPEERKKIYEEQRNKEWAEKAAKELNMSPEKLLQMKQEYHQREQSIAPYLNEMTNLWNHLIYGRSRQHKRQMDGYFKSGTEIDVQKAIDAYPQIQNAQFDETRIFRKITSKEVITEKPEKIRIRLVGDMSGSIDQSKRLVLQQAFTLILSSLDQFNYLLESERSITKSKLTVETQAYVFGDNAVKVKDFNNTNPMTANLKAFTYLHNTIGSTYDHTALNEIENSLTPDDKEDIKKGKVLDIVFEITDGGSSDKNMSHTAVAKLRDTGIITRAFQIGDVSPDEKEIFKYVWNTHDPEKEYGHIVGPDIAQLLPAMTKVLKEYLSGIRI